MSSQRYTDEFKIEAVKQITEEGHTVPDVAKRLGVTSNSLYKWVKKYGESPERAAAIRTERAETQRLKKELKRVTEERDILKKAAAYFAKQSG
jgi:transposase-like protein